MARPRHPLILLAALALIATWTAAQTDTSGMSPGRLEAAGIAAIESGDLDTAETMFRAHIAALPNSFTGWYNLAAVGCLRGDPATAEDLLSKAITLGFSDIHTLRQDPHLEPLRDRDLYQQVIARWSELMDARREVDLASARQLVPRNAETRTLVSWRLELVSAHDEIATDQANAEIADLCVWATDTLFTDLEPGSFDEDPYAFVILPDRANFAKWAIATFGPGARAGISAIGGAYDLNRRRLVAQDLGATLRHELIHVLHWRDMQRRNQTHAAWVQEGLASLIEDYDRDGPDSNTGTPVPVPSWRTNIVKRLQEANRLPTLESLSGTSLERFTASRPLAKYAQARTVMLFLQDQDLLTDFYRAYTETYDQDPTAMLALRLVTDLEQPALERAYEDWVIALPTVPETGSDLPATLGITVENGSGDGCRVTELPPGARQRTGLRIGSFITSINDRPTRDLAELIRVLADYLPGDTVTLSHRRGRVHQTTEVELLPRD